MRRTDFSRRQRSRDLLQRASGTTVRDYILMQCGELDYSFNVIQCINLVY